MVRYSRRPVWWALAIALAALGAFGAVLLLVQLQWEPLQALDGDISPALRQVAVGTVFVVAVGLSRVLSGVHWAGDVLGALLLSAGWTLAMVAAFWPRSAQGGRLSRRQTR